ncbi:MAG: hypothetical protein ACT6FC_01580, partial [Methanosarcinaceae archaeon]
MSERKIWEFRNQTICTILGLTFSDKELHNICKKLKVKLKVKVKLDLNLNLNPNLKLSNDRIKAHEMHASLVQACTTQNKTSRQMDKLLAD